LRWLIEAITGIDFSLPVIGLILLVLLFGFGPLLLVGLFGAQGLGLKVLVAAGPLFVALAFAIMTYYFGTRYAPQTGMSQGRVWFLVALFVVFGLLMGWGLFVSV
jgi:hypothetical protein